MSDDSDDGGTDDGKRQIQLLGAGFVIAGIVIFLLSNAPDSRGLLVLLLGFLGFAALVLEKTQDYTAGISFGLLTAGIVVWTWPWIRTGDVGYDYLGVLTVVIGLVNVLLAPIGLYFRQLGVRIGERTRGKD